MAKKKAVTLPASEPIGNFPPAEVDTESEEGQTVEEQLDSDSLQYLEDPQSFIDAFLADYAKRESDQSKVHIVAEALKEVLGVAATFVPGVGIGVKVIDAIEKGVDKASASTAG